ncbi:MAG: 50S ribosomal protein L13 [Nitrosopumilus sp.]|nr:50S ribosomal protein L13 [Nitrosopumilus sp.]MBT7933722.1 50S ribosomal protein L13 [Thiotrichales bacterium]MBT3686235.1 50S ribosomal protein L13 [Nitrosopumilus sp.]MBT3925215.1 50S ribosomal protein L13 [Nitrosopumilus sp.]MBT4216624.1 50S ribosomal protein L13 [Nitrosopumilus sp.]
MANGRINKPAGRNSNTSKQEIVIRVDRPVVVDATNHIAGRLASNVAKLLLQGQRVTVVNCEKIMMSGKRETQIREYREFLEINSIINYKHGPVHYRRPDTMMAKMIRQMLPFDRKPSGKLAFARLRTYIGAPNNTKPIEKIQFEKALITRAASNYTPLAEICRVIGWTE